jgi:integrase
MKRLGRKSGNWLTRNQAQELGSAASTADLRGWRDRAIVGLLLGCGLRRSEVVGLTLDQLQTRDGRWVIVDLIGKGRRLRTVPVPSWSKQLLDAWLRHSGVSDGRVFRRVSKLGKRQEAGVTANVVWYAVKRCARQAGIANLAPTIFVAPVPDSAMIATANSTDSVSAWTRFRSDNGAIHRQQTETTGRSY